MERETKYSGFNVYASDDGWRARISLSSTMTGEEGLEKSENFSASLNLPVDNPTVPPSEIRKEIIKEIIEKFIKTYEEVSSQLKDIQFD